VLGVQIYGPGIKVLLATPENARQGIKWGFIAVSGIAFTLTTGYILYLLRSRWFGIRNAYLRHFFLYSLVVLLCGDPFYYVCYPILGTGDIVGVSSFFGVPIALVYLIALSLLALNIYLARYRVGSEMKAMGLLHQP